MVSEFVSPAHVVIAVINPPIPKKKNVNPKCVVSISIKNMPRKSQNSGVCRKSAIAILYYDTLKLSLFLASVLVDILKILPTELTILATSERFDGTIIVLFIFASFPNSSR